MSVRRPGGDAGHDQPHQRGLELARDEAGVERRQHRLEDAGHSLEE